MRRLNRHDDFGLADIHHSAPAATASVTTQAPTTTTIEAVPAATDATTTTSTVSEEQLAAAAAVGDIAAGVELFNKSVAGVASCSSCHSPSSEARNLGPALVGVAALATGQVDGMSDVEYLRQSILDPLALEGGDEWGTVMPGEYPDKLSEDQINGLIAFMLTR